MSWHDLPLCLLGVRQSFIKNKCSKTKHLKEYREGCLNCKYKFLCDGVIIKDDANNRFDIEIKQTTLF